MDFSAYADLSPDEVVQEYFSVPRMIKFLRTLAWGEFVPAGTPDGEALHVALHLDPPSPFVIFSGMIRFCSNEFIHTFLKTTGTLELTNHLINYGLFIMEIQANYLNAAGVVTYSKEVKPS